MPGKRRSGDGRDDARLVKGCLEGDTEAFSVLVDRYQERVYNIVYRMVGDREEARDLSQDAFVKAFEGIGTFDAELPFSSWMYRIGTNVAIDHLRRKKLAGVPLEDAFQGGEAPSGSRADGEPPAPDGELPETVSISNETSAALNRALLELPEKYRAVVVFHHLEGLSYAEISKILGIPRNTAKTWARRARGLLCESLEGVI